MSPVAAFVLAGVHHYYYGLSWGWIIFFVLSCVLPSMSITGGYHRLYSHRSYEAKPWLRLFYAICGATSFQGSILRWTIDHRQHHRATDTESDPHNINQGFFHAHMGWLFWKGAEIDYNKLPRDLASDPIVMWQDKYYLPLAIGVGLILPGFIGKFFFGSFLGGMCYGGFMRAVISQHFTFFINSACHYFGTRPYDVHATARDSVVMAFLAFGEGYHNFHHRFETDFRNGIRWYHWDPTKWWITAMSWFGVTSKMRVTSEETILKARLEAGELSLKLRGIPDEYFAPVKSKVETAQTRFKLVCLEYKKLKRELSRSSKLKYLELKTQLKMSRIEFKNAKAQWKWVMKAYSRGPVGVPVFQP